MAQHEANETWNSALSWLPADDPQYALDPDDDEVLDGNIMEDLNMHPEDTPTTAKGKKQVHRGCQYGHAFCDLGLNLISLQCWPYVF